MRSSFSTRARGTYGLSKTQIILAVVFVFTIAALLLVVTLMPAAGEQITASMGPAKDAPGIVVPGNQ
jgi:hypothetical protein